MKRLLLILVCVITTMVTPISGLLPYFTSRVSAVTPESPGGTSTSPANFDTSVNQFIDTSTIYYNGRFYFDGKIDSNYTYIEQGSYTGCKPSEIHLNHVTDPGIDEGSANAWIVNYKPQDRATGACDAYPNQSITLQNAQRVNMPFDYIDNNTIITSDKQVTYKLDTTGDSYNGDYLETGGDQCKDILAVNSAPVSDTDYALLNVTASTGGNNIAYQDWANGLTFQSFQSLQSTMVASCAQYGPQQYEASTVYLNNSSLLKASPVAQYAASASATQLSGGGGGGGQSTPTCESSGGPLSWIFCALIEEINKAESYLEQVVQSLLQTPPLKFPPSAGDGISSATYNVWSNFRVYGDILLVIALLVVVFGESIGGGLIDAYTAKKMLPRILAAAILINISIYIVAIAEDIVNILGIGIGDLIKTPFQNAGDWKISIDGFTGSAATTGIIGGALVWGAGGGAALASLGLMVALPVILAVFGVLVTLIFRQAILVFLIFIAPVAFALYVLPNTERFFRKWWELLFKTLMVYPIVSVIFSMASIAGIVVNSLPLPGSIQWIAKLLGALALVAPLFLVPYAFRLAGGALGAIHETVTNYRQKAHGAIAGSAQDPGSLRNRLRARSGMARAERNVSWGAAGALLNPRGGGIGARRGALRARRETAMTNMGQKYLESDGVYQSNKDNDMFLMAVANEKLARQKMESASSPAEKAAYQQAINAASLVHKSAATKMTAAQALAATGYQFSAGEKGYNELAQTMIETLGISKSDVDADYDSQGNITKFRGVRGADAGVFANAMDNAQFRLKGAGRFELGGINRGAGYNPRAGFNKASGYTVGQSKPDTFAAGAEAFLGAQLADGKTPDSTTLTQGIVNGLGNGTVTEDDVVQWHNNLLQAMQSPTFANDPEIQKQIAAINDLNRVATPDNEALLNSITGITGRTRENTARTRRGIDPNIIESGGAAP